MGSPKISKSKFFVQMFPKLISSSTIYLLNYWFMSIVTTTIVSPRCLINSTVDSKLIHKNSVFPFSTLYWIHSFGKGIPFESIGIIGRLQKSRFKDRVGSDRIGSDVGNHHRTFCWFHRQSRHWHRKVQHPPTATTTTTTATIPQFNWLILLLH